MSGGKDNSLFYTLIHIDMSQNSFLEGVQKGYSFKGETLKIGRAILNGEVVEGADVYLPLSTMNRHGLIAGATGTGKTKTLQVLAEGLSDASVPVLLLDIKGDLSGLAAQGAVNDKITDRAHKLGIEYKPESYPVELLTLSDQPGVRLRATVSEFGPVLLSKILGLNDTQGGVVALIFKYCDDHELPLLDLKDFIKVLQYLNNEGKQEMEKQYGKIAGTTTGT
ncbi:MAG TPA: helicase HerA-like domain-containing protein, partial [Chitinophagaceae bacterium]